jgi:hypothetical protein
MNESGSRPENTQRIPSLKIAQPFMAGDWPVSEKKSRMGRKKIYGMRLVFQSIHDRLHIGPIRPIGPIPRVPTLKFSIRFFPIKADSKT